MTRTAVVLAGGAAHGAYEVGVLRYLLDEVARELPPACRVDVLCGTSAGAINACGLAAFADQPGEGVRRLREAWGRLQLRDILVPSAPGLLAMVATLLGAGPRASHRGALFAQRPLRRLFERTIPFARIGAGIRSGALAALSISATHVATGHTIVFVQQRHPRVIDGGYGRDTVARSAEIGVEHLVASCAVPMLFPAVRIGGELYCDGGLRQMLPLSPALRLGADAVVVVNPRHLPEAEPDSIRRARERAYGSPIFLLGRTLDVLLVDRVADDLDRLRQVNAILEAGSRRYGPRFVAEIDRGMRAAGRRPVRPVATVEVCSSEDLARVAADYVRSRRFAARAGRVYGCVFRRLAEAEGSQETTFLSYLLFDGEFARDLMDLGYADAKARHAELVALLSRETEPRAEPGA